MIAMPTMFFTEVTPRALKGTLTRSPSHAAKGTACEGSGN
jgi:hypothetical protein